MKNIAYLSLIQAANFIFPILMYSYFINIVGESQYGEILLYQTVILYFSLIINFGFNISGVKNIVDCEGDYSKISIVFSSIIYIKTFLFLSAFILLMIVSISFDFHINTFLLLCCSIMLIYDWLFPQWFFQAVEKLELVFFLSAITKIMSVFLLILFLKEAEDYFLIPIFMGVSSAFVGLCSLLIVKKSGVKLVSISFNQLFANFKEASFIFLSTFLLNIKSRADILLVGLIIGLNQVVFFDFSMKVLSLAVIPIGIINNAFYARLSNENDNRLLKKVLICSFLFGVIAFLFTLMASQYLLDYINLDNLKLSPLINLISICIVLLSINVALELNGLIAWGHKKVVLIGSFFNFIIYVVGVLLIYVCTQPEIKYFIYLTIFIHSFELVFRLIMCLKYKILK